MSECEGGKVLFTKGAESAILPFATGGEMEKTRLHVDEFALVRGNLGTVWNPVVLSGSSSSFMMERLPRWVVGGTNVRFWHPPRDPPPVLTRGPADTPVLHDK